uniref:SFRICE_010380 n=1 Tax=Spodoptera frugiperda TaxID=7108 RepID=A0A2H1W6E9_SPOFR
MPHFLPALYVFTNIVQNLSSPVVDMKLNTFENLHQHDVPPGQYPFVVTIITMDNVTVTRHCTGSLLRKNWVLSSAHCFTEPLEKKYYVWYDNFTTSPLDTSMFSKVVKIYNHPKYNHSQFNSHPSFFFGDNDISLLRVVKVSKSSYGKLSSVHYSKMSGLPVTYIGGASKYHRINEYPPLQFAEGIIITCGSALTMWSKYVLCVAPKCTEKTHQPLHGDFGGPFIYDGKIIGVMTTNFKISKSALLSNGITPISPYRDWIKHVMSDKKGLTGLL